MSDLESFRLDAAALAKIDRQIAAKVDWPDPDELIDILQEAPLGESLDIPAAIVLLAVHHGCSAAEAQDELFAAIEGGALHVELP